MKNKLYIFILLFLILGCSSDDDSCVGIDCLPEATQTGAGTFGCLVNGEPFVDNSGDFNCFYQLVDGEYNFSISAGAVVNSFPRALRLSTNAIEMVENSTYDLVEKGQGNAHAAVIFYFEGFQANENTTDESNRGLLHLTKLDFQNNIISGSFHFQVKDTLNNKIYEFTEGHFDAQFNQ